MYCLSSEQPIASRQRMISSSTCEIFGGPLFLPFTCLPSLYLSGHDPVCARRTVTHLLFGEAALKPISLPTHARLPPPTPSVFTRDSYHQARDDVLCARGDGRIWKNV